MSDGLREAWGLGEPNAVPSTEESDEFRRSFQDALQSINQSLRYTAANAEQTKQQDYAAKRDKLITVYQAVLERFQETDVAPAQAAAGKAIDAMRTTVETAAKFKDDVQQAVGRWSDSEGLFDELRTQVNELEEWGDAKAGAFRQVVEKIQQQVDQRLYQPAVQAVQQVVEKMGPVYEQAKLVFDLKELYQQRVAALTPELSQPSTPQEISALQSQMEQAAAEGDYERALTTLDQAEAQLAEFKRTHSQETTRQGDVVRTETIGDVAASAARGDGYDPATGKVTDGIDVQAHATAYGVKKTGGPVSGEAKIGHVEGQAQWGRHYDPQTGALLEGAKISGKAVAVEVNADTPVGKYEGSIGKLEGEGVVGYEYDPEKKVHFAGVKGKAAVTGVDGKLEGKYGKLEGKALSAGVDVKSGAEYDEKTGKTYVGTTLKAEAVGAELAGELKTPDDTLKLTGEVQAFKAEAVLDGNIVADQYGWEIFGKASAEANILKGGAGVEYRLTPKALFDYTVGVATGTEAPEYLDFGPVIGGKISGAAGAVGGGIEGGARLGIDEVHVRGGGFIEVAAGVGLDVKGGFRLGPLKYAVEHGDEVYDEVNQAVDDATRQVNEKVTEVAREVESAASRATEAIVDTAETIDRGRRIVTDAAADAIDKATELAKSGLQEAERLAREKAAEVEQWAQEQIESTEQWADNRAAEAGKALQDARQQAEHAAAEIKDWAADSASQAADAAVETKDWLADRATETWNSLWGDA